MLENAWESVQEVRAKKKSEKRDAIIKQIDLARLEGDVEKIRKLAIKLNTLG